MTPITQTYALQNEAAMGELAGRLARVLRCGDVLCLQGPLGAGKSSFARAVVQALSSHHEEVPSPTFTLVQTYETQPEIWHFDLYRLEGEDGILELGWEEARRQGAALVEWPERLGRFLPKDRLDIDISFNKDSDNARQVEITPHGESWACRFKEFNPR